MISEGREHTAAKEGSDLSGHFTGISDIRQDTAKVMNKKMATAIWIILTLISPPLEAADTGHIKSTPAPTLPVTPFHAIEPESTAVYNGIRFRYDVTRPEAIGGIMPSRAADEPLNETAVLPLLTRHFQLRISAAASRAPKKRIRAKVINIIKQYNETMGWLSDFLLPGSDLALRLEIDPGDEEVILEWNLRF